MPEKVLPTAEAFGEFEARMLKKGFRKVGGAEFSNDFKRLGLTAPRSREGREVGFTFHANDLEVRVWTTWLEAEGEARPEDAGWVLIKDGDDARYFSHPIHRTKNFLRRLFFWAQVAQQRVEKRPLCPSCHAHMRIASGKALKSRYWECQRAFQHPDKKVRTTGWDIGLTPKAQTFVCKERELRQRDRDRAKAKGREPVPAILTRKPWVPTRPENLVPASD